MTKPTLRFNQQAIPYSEHCDDIYFDHELDYQQKEQISILREMGVGTSLIFLLALQVYHKLPQAVRQKT